MPYCCVPFCRGGNKNLIQVRREENLPEFHYFKPPKDQDLRRQWEANISRKGGLKDVHNVCSEHFTPDQLDLSFQTTLKDGTVFEMPRERARLKPGAVPTIFPEYPIYLQPRQKRKPLKPRGSATVPHKRRRVVVDESQGEELHVNNYPAAEVPSTSAMPVASDGLHIEPETQPNWSHEMGEDLHVEENLPASEDASSSTTLLASDKLRVETETRPSWSHEMAIHLELPVDWVLCNTACAERKTLVLINAVTLTIEKAILFEENNFSVKVRGLDFDISVLKVKSSVIQTVPEAQSVLLEVDKLRLCPGTDDNDHQCSFHCSGVIVGRALKCKSCLDESRRIRRMEIRKQKTVERKKKKSVKRKWQKQSLCRSKAKMLLQIQSYREQILSLQSECVKKSEEVLNKSIAALPPCEQEAVKACFSVSKKKGPTGNRYTIQWVYECMLMRIKDRKLYAHIRENKILAVPSIAQIYRYLRNYGGIFGFEPQTLELLRRKAIELKMPKRRGVILVDEMKLLPGAYFDPSTLQVCGIKDMGYRREEELGEDFKIIVCKTLETLPKDPKAIQKAKRQSQREKKCENERDKNLGDHALVISFQPFQGKWVQAVACFLTRGNAKQDELTKLILEATILLERSCLFVDGVVTDGARWNMAMWEKFGVTADKPGVEHPCDPDRKLWFVSDFPHLLKCMRNCFTDKKLIHTPEGDVKLEHWQAVLDTDNVKKVGLIECPRLTQDHLHPNPFQKMNVGMAWQFWSSSASAAMQSYKLQGVEQLQDCDASAFFCKYINNLADVMNSNRPVNALRPDSEQFKLIEEFRHYMKTLLAMETVKKRTIPEHAEEQKRNSGEKNGKSFRKLSPQAMNSCGTIFSESTDYDILVTLQSAIELTKFLTSEKIGFSYVMTSRLNQDALEHFFGLVRQSCGANTHPEPRVFAQLFRLLSIYSLVKPIKGSNITGGEMLTTLLDLKDLKSKTCEERKFELSARLDNIISNGENLDYIPELMAQIDHEYLGESVDEFALRYVAGFTARHSFKYAGKCEACQQSLKTSDGERVTENLLISFKSKGFLTYPSHSLLDLLRTLEQQIITTSLKNEMEENWLFKVLDSLENVHVRSIGCEDHKHDLTKAVMKFFLIMRMHFVCRRWNTETRKQKKRQKALRKQAHLT